MNKPCTYLGTRWDSSNCVIFPDLDNRCFARFRRVPFFWVFKKKLLGAPIDITHQTECCYGNHCECGAYQRKAAQATRTPPASR